MSFSPRKILMALAAPVLSILVAMVITSIILLAAKDPVGVPVIGVASSGWTTAQLHARITDSLKNAGAAVDPAALERLLARVVYVSGDYRDPATFAMIRAALNGASRPPTTWPFHRRFSAP